MSTQTSLPRPRWYTAAIVGAVVAIATLSAAALLTDDDLADGVFGFFTGMICMLLIAVVLWVEFGRNKLARMRDAAALDDLEPLRTATRADKTVSPSSAPDAPNNAVER